MAARIFAVVAAVFLVTAVALCTLMPQGLTLGQGLLMLDRGSPAWLRAHSAAWLWDWVELPFLLRPLWLLPAFLGLICVGLSVTLNGGKPSPRRRRS